jgi:hypothetical protein
MATINVRGCGHGSRSETYAGGLVVQYGEFRTTSAAERARLEKVTRACQSIDRLDAAMGIASACNAYFTALPKGQPFRAYWRDPTVFINYSPSTSVGVFAATHSNDKDITLTRWCVEHHNHWMIGATIVHELAHIGGAPGGVSHAAERAAHECGFRPQYDPIILGTLRSLAGLLERIA